MGIYQLRMIISGQITCHGDTGNGDKHEFSPAAVQDESRIHKPKYDPDKAAALDTSSEEEKGR